MVSHIAKAPYVLRPANYPPGTPGRGWWVYQCRQNKQKAEEHQREHQKEHQKIEEKLIEGENPGVSEDAENDENGIRQGETKTENALGNRERGDAKVGVICMLGQSGFRRVHLSNPFTYIQELTRKIKQETNIVIVDFHARTTAEKYSFFFHADGLASAVCGSHAKVLTADEAILPGGTGIICDTGRTGSTGGVGGFEPGVEIGQFLTGIPARSQEWWQKLEIQGVLLDIDDSGKTTRIERIRVPVEPPDDANAPGVKD